MSQFFKSQIHVCGFGGREHIGIKIKIIIIKGIHVWLLIFPETKTEK